MIANLRHFVPRNTLLKIYQSLIHPYISYGLTVWGLASKAYLNKILVEVTGSSPVEVLNFFQASLRSCKNCDHNCEDHSSFENSCSSKTSAQVYILYFTIRALPHLKIFIFKHLG